MPVGCTERQPNIDVDYSWSLQWFIGWIAIRFVCSRPKVKELYHIWNAANRIWKCWTKNIAKNCQAQNYFIHWCALGSEELFVCLFTACKYLISIFFSNLVFDLLCELPILCRLLNSISTELKFMASYVAKYLWYSLFLTFYAHSTLLHPICFFLGKFVCV